MRVKHWLMKSEPDVYSIDQLEKERTGSWDGVRNYQARNFMRDGMKRGDLVLFYHSNTKPPGVAGIAKVAREAYPDHSAFDPRSPYYDPKSTPGNPIWVMVDLAFVERFPGTVSLDELKATPELDGMLVTRRGQRLSVQPVEAEHFRIVRRLGRKSRPPG